MMGENSIRLNVPLGREEGFQVVTPFLDESKE